MAIVLQYPADRVGLAAWHCAGEEVIFDDEATCVSVGEFLHCMATSARGRPGRAPKSFLPQLAAWAEQPRVRARASAKNKTRRLSGGHISVFDVLSRRRHQ